MIFRKLTMLFAAATAFAAPAAAQLKTATDWATKPVPVEIFAQFPMIDDPHISQDGKWIVAKVRAQGQQVLAILAIGQAGVPPQFVAKDGDFDTDKQGERQIIGYNWLDPDHLLIALDQRDNFQGGWFDNIRYASYNRLTRKIVPLGWDQAFADTHILWRSHSGPAHILLQRRNPAYGTEMLMHPEVIDINVDNGQSRTVVRPNPIVSSWRADMDGVVRFGSGGDADTGKRTILYRPSADAQFKTLYSGVPDRFDPVVTPDLILAKSNTAYAFSNKDGYQALYTYDLVTMKLGKKVFGVDGYDIDDSDRAVLSADRTRLDGLSVTKGRAEHVYFDPTMRDIQSALEDMFGKGSVYIAGTDEARHKVVFRYGAAGQAESWYVFDTTTGGVGRFAYANDTLKDEMMNPVSVVRYTASDGKPIEAILTMPRLRAGQKNLALVVMPHGGPWARDDADWSPYGWNQALAEQGYVVIQPNYRGSTGYGKEWEKGGEKAWGYRMQDDLNDAVTYLAKQGTVDAKRVCMMGWSYGGYAASRAAERDGDKYRCTISGAGVHDLPAMVQHDKNYLGRYGAKTYLGNAGDLVDVSPGLHPEKYSTPILIIQGVRDQRVPVSQSRNLVAALKRAGKVEGKDFVYVEQPLNTHNLLREEDRKQVLTETLKFLKEHNPA